MARIPSIITFPFIVEIIKKKLPFLQRKKAAGYLYQSELLRLVTGLYGFSFILSFCPKFSNANLAYEDRYAIDLQMQVWHMKIDMQLIFRLDRAKFLFQNLPYLFCLPIT